jgi:predicted Na+-dependent transporter
MYKATLSIIFLVFIIGAIFGMKKYAILGSRWGKILIGLLFLHHLMTVYLFGIFIKTWDEFTY